MILFALSSMSCDTLTSELVQSEEKYFLKREFFNEFISDDKYSDFLEVFKTIDYQVKTNDTLKGASFDKTAYVVDTFGPRLWGSPALEAAINYMKTQMEKDGFDKVVLEKIDNVPVWKRGNEYLLLRSPRKVPTKIPMIGLGLSVGGSVLDKEVVVVNNFDELDRADLTDKVVLLNGQWDKSYSNTVKYRSEGAARAAKRGALGIIIRTIGPKSLENPHTGRVDYDKDESVKKIPACAISLEDADMLARMYKRKQVIKVDLVMEAKFDGFTTTNNLVGDFLGSEKPDEIVLLGGHVDSWDTGPQTGANDDLGGFYVCYEAVRTLISLGLKPKRTLRVVGWSGEEMGFPNKGAFEYAKNHEKELDKHVVAFESDEGVTQIKGFGLNGSIKAYSVLNTIMKIMKGNYDYNNLYYNYGSAVDTKPLYEKGIPQMVNSLGDPTKDNYNDQYFYYHHSAADTMSILTKDAMDSNVIAIAQMFYAIADLPKMLPKNNE